MVVFPAIVFPVPTDLFMASLSSRHHGLLGSLGEAEVVDRVRRPVAAEQVADDVQVAELRRVDERAGLRFVNLGQKL
jgi:hypothetical protein